MFAKLGLRVRLRSWIVVACALLVAAIGVRVLVPGVDKADAPAWTCGMSQMPRTLHVKLRAVPDAQRMEALGDVWVADVTPLFSTPSTDERGQWVRVESYPAAITTTLAAMQMDANVLDAFEVPQTDLATGLHRLPRHNDQSPMPRHHDDGESCPIITPSFESYQGYLGPAPHGIDAPAAWRRGQRGAGVWFADIEGGWNAKHEDLPGDRITHVGGKPINDWTWRAHGTAVLGEVVGKDNGKGVVGIAPDVERVFTSSIGGTSVADAIDVAARKLRPGDVLLIELQSSGPRGAWIPVEWWNDVFDAIKAATDRGVVVIEAAGNGYEDLDHRAYQGRFDRSKRDSGAIVVGAGAPPRTGFADRERLDFSNYGARVDVQGWGRKVATLDYGDLQDCSTTSEADRHYTGEFSGTSSASPIVAGAAVILEGVARSKRGVITPRELRDLLRRTGTPQAGDTSKHIGPRPDLARAMRELDR
ncbi:MAG: S8 family peptidase [Kofleriaceae bacterium]